jgi:hypothetical protein
VTADFSNNTVFVQLAIANRDGLLQVVGWKRFEPIYTCRVPLQGSITALQLGGAIGKVEINILRDT